MNNKLVASISIVGLVLALYGVMKTTPAVNQNQSLGAVSGPDSFFPCESHNGVVTCSERKAFSTSSSTMVSFISPTATSTLRVAMARVTTASTTATQFEWGRSIFMDATTTSLGRFSMAAGVTGTLNASTSPSYTVPDPQTADLPYIIPPNTRVNLKAGNFVCTSGLTCSAIRGYAVVEFKY